MEFACVVLFAGWGNRSCEVRRGEEPGSSSFFIIKIQTSSNGGFGLQEFIVNSRELELFTCRWLPENREPKALIFLCHGYGMECSISMRGTGIRLAKAGFAVYGMDYEGHGKSSGLQGFIRDFEDLEAYHLLICFEERNENKRKTRFLLGESMGGAVALLLHRKKPIFWDGAVLVAPMCKIAEELKPHPLVINILTKMCRVIPTWKIIPTKDIIDSAIKDPEWREEVRNNPYCYKGRPRLKTGYELLMVSLDTEKNLNQISLPFLIVHGGDDTVTDPLISKALYDTASSEDKTFKLYPGMWHALTSGEPQENVDLVFSDIVSWLDERANTIDTRLEMGKEAGHKGH
ncbi:hypothetical protein AXF42_Ash017735 [Apostasia shenzhenica]|uniref:Serine aminopeptidase S33 domain-containing protein n=1 Tax=Apostasia shenzhenica TaxID=1088818 RepID=A0A2I0B642_9ASPA|nr:hypothetical protein AXF42_Ash017735 [Apostasia shenzhenica]